MPQVKCRNATGQQDARDGLRGGRRQQGQVSPRITTPGFVYLDLRRVAAY